MECLVHRVSDNYAFATAANFSRWIGSEAGRMARCARGVAALEFAFAGPVVIIAMLGALELSLLMFATTLMEGGLREASRFGITGNIPAGTTREARILEMIGSNTIGLVDMASAELSYKIYPSFGDVGKPEPYVDSSPANGAYDAGEDFTDINGNGQWDSDMGQAGLGGPGDVVLYTVSVDWDMFTPLIGSLMTDDGTLKLQSSIAVRNEPYPDAGGAS
jgi:Flp pilus assembly protein TadG